MIFSKYEKLMCCRQYNAAINDSKYSLLFNCYSVFIPISNSYYGPQLAQLLRVYILQSVCDRGGYFRWILKQSNVASNIFQRVYKDFLFLIF